MTDHAYARADEGSPVLGALQEVLGDRITTSMAVREHHGRGEDYFKPIPADAVCFPHSTEEVAEIVKICAANHTPIIPFGTGTLAGRPCDRAPWRRDDRHEPDGRCA